MKSFSNQNCSEEGGWKNREKNPIIEALTDNSQL